MREALIKAATFLAGLYFVVEFILPGSWCEAWGIEQLNEPISNGFVAIGSMAFGLGIINLIRIHGKAILFQNQGWFFSSALLLGLFSMLLFASLDWGANLSITKTADRISLLGSFAEKIVEDAEKNTPNVLAPLARQEFLLKGWTKEKESLPADILVKISDEESFKVVNEKLSSLVSSAQYNPEALHDLAKLFGEISSKYRAFANESYKQSTTKFLYSLLNEGVFVPLGAAMFALLGFYIAGAAYRAFHVRSVEALLMMLAAVIVICGQTSFTLSLYLGFSDMRAWLLQVPNSAAFRAITIGAGVAGLILAIRMWFSVESGVFGRKR